MVVKTCLQSTFKAWGAPKRLGNTAQTLLLPPAKTTWSDSNGRYGLQMIIYTRNISVEKLAPPSLSRAADANTQLQKATIGESQTPFVTRVSKKAQECTQAMVHNVIQLSYESHALFQATNSIEFGEQSTLMILSDLPHLWRTFCSGAYLGGSSYLLMPRLDETGTLYQQRATCPYSMTVSEQPAQFCVGECLHACTCGSTRTHRPGGNGRPGTRKRRKACTPL